MEESAQSAALAARAREVLAAYVERAARMVRSAPPGSIAPMIRTLHDLARLEEGKSTSNVAVSLSPAQRRARIVELAAQLYPDALEVGEAGPPDAR